VEVFLNLSDSSNQAVEILNQSLIFTPEDVRYK
jgi:hypothetical protein